MSQQHSLVEALSAAKWSRYSHFWSGWATATEHPILLWDLVLFLKPCGVDEKAGLVTDHLSFV